MSFCRRSLRATCSSIPAAFDGWSSQSKYMREPMDGGMNAETLTAEFVRVQADLDRCRREQTDLSKRKAELEREFLRWCDAQGVDSVKGNGVTLTRKEQPVARATDWDTFVTWANENGYSSMLYKRISGERVQELAVEGIELPDCLQLEFIERVTYRRA